MIVIDRIVTRSNFGATIYYIADGIDLTYKARFTNDLQFDLTGSPAILPSIPTIPYEVYIDAYDDGVLVESSDAYAYTPESTTKSFGRVLRQQLTDIFHFNPIENTILAMNSAGFYTDIYADKTSISTKKTTIGIGVPLLREASLNTEIRRTEIWQAPIHLQISRATFDLAHDEINEIVAQILTTLEKKDYLGLHWAGVADAGHRYTTDMSIDEETNTVLYTLMIDVTFHVQI